jgi:hypothetical protein
VRARVRGLALNTSLSCGHDGAVDATRRLPELTAGNLPPQAFHCLLAQRPSPCAAVKTRPHPNRAPQELKNGRLAMVAFLGFVAQHAATGKAPLAALGDHIAAPWAANFATNGVSLPF